ncbi:MAG: efflux RND transporter periplasmic adaptor subunit [Rhodobacteraceae bacterium]|nr:efflux RND transporter periplasmic adaptor subunit [Paracoccaceae bacterium]
MMPSLVNRLMQAHGVARISKVAIFSMALTAPLVLAPSQIAAQGRAASVVVDFVDTREIAETAPVIGRLAPSVESRVAARTAGVVAEVSVQVGSAVKKGDEIARLDDELHKIERRARAAAVAEAEAGAYVANAQLRLAEQALKRMDRLKDSTAFNQSSFEDDEARVAEASAARLRAYAAVESSRAALARADYDLARTKITAPFDGVVLEKMAQPGQYISVGDATATLLDLGGLEIEADVPTDLIGGLEVGAEFEIAFEAGGGGSAIMRAAVPQAALSTRTRPVRFSLDLSAIDASRLADGEAVTVYLPAGPARSVITAPKDALVNAVGGWVVFVVEDGKAASRPVTVGAPAADRVEIRSGLQPGDMVVVRGNERLRPGQPVTPRQASERGGASPATAASKSQG